MKTILIVNNTKEKCGVHQYGKNVFLAVKDSTKYRFEYVTCEGPGPVQFAVFNHKPAAIIYNYYPLTMKWAKRSFVKSLGVPSIGTFHEVTQAEADSMTDNLFDLHICLDPDVIENNPRIKALGRIIPAYVNNFPLPSVPTFGAFGFGIRDQGYETTVNMIQDEYDEAIIRIHLPGNDIIDPNGQSHALKTADYCKKLVKKTGIKLELSHKFMSKADLLDYLAKNTANCFLRDVKPKKGKSSALDFGLAVRRPVILTRCQMYSHLFNTSPSPFVEDRSIREIVADGTAPLEQYYNMWTECAFRTRIEQILDELLCQ